ncbi:Asp-tRNA(Asn)/Glu-tRNA(Gln) amidotransferase subunit GatC [Allofustis seminis]|uniref:Asp-tRNA(Asn)/Glu-tRNA(Gln) amidotransferase subunit GatC n=1 Tax=Allofustis seminis TaxID=166939 RepID=UPI0003743B4F|nr:Asp-tRNA(Asn)/Glu-tRNA(Gln) amidotransferase subunit GatC [Allofustis seminis]
MIDKKQVLALAKTMKFSLTDEEADRYSHKLSEIINYLELIQEVDTTDVTPTYYGIVGQLASLREDVAEQSTQSEQLLNNASDTEGAYVRVPAILNDGQGGA